MNDLRKHNATLADVAYERLRADLLACRLRPGDPIRMNEVSAQFGTNLSAVREALSRLAAEGLVISEPQKGFRAAPISVDELRDITAVRIEVEASCLRRAIAKGNVNWETGIVAALHRLLRTPERAADDPRRKSDEWAEAHARFHEALVANCESPCLLRIRSSLFDQSERYRRLSVPLAEFDRDLDREHREIAEAALDRDATQAVQRMTNHLQATADILLQQHIESQLGTEPNKLYNTEDT